MSRHSRHPELHRSERVGWACRRAGRQRWHRLGGRPGGRRGGQRRLAAILATGVAGTVAGAMSMAAGEYVSVQTQADTEAADLAMESASCAKTRTANWRSWPRSTATAAWSLRWRGRWPNSLPPTMRWVPTPAMSWASPTPCAPPAAGSAGLGRCVHLRCGAASADRPARAGRQGRTDDHASTLLGLCLTGAVAAQAGGARLCAIRVMFWGALAMAPLPASVACSAPGVMTGMLPAALHCWPRWPAWPAGAPKVMPASPHAASMAPARWRFRNRSSRSCWKAASRCVPRTSR
jgi:hypothetical protein